MEAAKQKTIQNKNQERIQDKSSIGFKSWLQLTKGHPIMAFGAPTKHWSMAFETWVKTYKKVVSQGLVKAREDIVSTQNALLLTGFWLQVVMWGNSDKTYLNQGLPKLTEIIPISQFMHASSLLPHKIKTICTKKNSLKAIHDGMDVISPLSSNYQYISPQSVNLQQEQTRMQTIWQTSDRRQNVK